MEYEEFLYKKIRIAERYGFDVADDEVHAILKPHQRDTVQWAVAGGCRAIFAAFGLGKSVVQLETLRLTLAHAGGQRALIIAPLGVRQEFKRDAEMLDQAIAFVRRDDELAGPGLYITNYESVRDGKLDPNRFDAVSLDEASVLRSFGSKTYQTFLAQFADVPHRFVATATPSPNRYKELIHYAAFLGIMDSGQALTRFFQRDSQKANNLTIYPHKEREFWLWVSSWALFLQRPSDLGYDDSGYDLPPLRVHYHEVPIDHAEAGFERDGQARMFQEATLGLSEASTAKRDSMAGRVEALRAILDADPDAHYLLWHDLEDERRAIEKAVPEAVSVYGAQDLDEREQRVIDFSNGRFKYLTTKPVLSGSGCNFQRYCHKAVFLGIGYKFNDFVQSIHRIYRFLQAHECEIHIIYSEAEREILRALLDKWTQHDEMVAQMSEIIREYGLSNTGFDSELKRDMGIERIASSGEHYTVANNDCVAETQAMDSDSVGLIVTSIPFANHYEYTPNYSDFGHTDDNGHFWQQMDYLTPETLRVLQPGRIAVIHVKDRINFGNVTGAGIPTVSPFHAEAIAHYTRHGFDYMGMITVVTDVVRENNQTYRLGWSEQCKDGSKMGVGSPEYILIFHKPQTDRTKGYADIPVKKSKAEYSRARWQTDAHAYWRSSGDRHLTAEEMAQYGPDKLAKIFTEYSLAHVYDHAHHVELGEWLDERGALPSQFMALAPGSHAEHVWHDVNRMRTLNGEQKNRNVQAHICLARDSLVLTRRGLVPIQEVRVGDMTLTHKGRWRPVEVVANTGVRPVVDIRAQGVAALTLTPEHKIWTRKSDWARSRDGAERVAPCWIRADETVGGYVNLKLPPIEETCLTEQECWLIGRWLADGHVGTRGDFHVSIGQEKVAEFKRMAGEHAGTMAERSAMQFRLKGMSARMTDMLSRCGHGAAGKQMPVELLALPPDRARALLNGYLSGDGHFVVDRGTWMATSISRSLLLGAAMLAQRVHGSVANLRPGRAAGSTVIEGREVQTRQEWILSFDVQGGRRKSPFIMEDGAWKKVRSANQAGETETWCLRVAGDESFTAEGCIVKNCPLQVDIVQRLIERYSNTGDVVYDPFAGLGTVPYIAVQKGRYGRGSELNPDYFRDSLVYLEAAERERSMPSLFDFCDDGEAA